MNCPRCGKVLSDNARFCTGCGRQLTSNKVNAPSQIVSVKPNIGANIPPPPQFPSPSRDYKLEQYRNLYRESQKSHPEVVESTGWHYNQLYGVIIFLIILGGYFGSRMISSGVHGEPFSGTYTNAEYKYSLFLPDNWYIVKDPVSKTHFSDSVGYFFKGSSRNPDIQLFINYSIGGSGIPRYFSGDQLDALEPQLKKMVSDVKQRMGFNYEYLRLSTFTINKRDAFWIEGNVSKGNKPPLRDFTFMTFEDSRMYIIGFTMDESKTEAFWPEIKNILSSMTFF